MGHSKRKSFDYCVDDAMLQTIDKQKVKQTQKDILCKHACAECPRIKGVGASTAPLENKYYTHPEGRTNVSRRKSKYLVTMQGDANTPPKQRKMFKCCKRKMQAEPELVHYKHTGDIDDINKQENNVKKNPHNNVPLCQCPPDDRRSNGSLSRKLRKSKIYQHTGEKCSCLGKVIFSDTKAQTEILPEKKNKKTGIKNKKHSTKESENENNKTDIKLEIKPKYNDDIDISKTKQDKKFRNSKLSENPKHINKNSCLCPPKEIVVKKHNICDRGICAEASKKKQIDFVCKCDKKPIECTDLTCRTLLVPKEEENNGNKFTHVYRKYSQKILSNKIKLSTQSTPKKDVISRISKQEKIGHKLACLCRKYSQKILPNNNEILNQPTTDDVCDKGICKVAKMHKQENFICKCAKKPKITECTNETCNVTEPKGKPLKSTLSQTRTLKRKDNYVSPDSCEPGCPKLCFKDRIINKWSRRKTGLPEHVNIQPTNAGDQTGEPFIEIKVDAVDMCVLNPNDIKNKVIDLSKTYKVKPTCICPSHKKRREEFLDKDLCGGGICHKTFKNRKTNFNCKCEKGGECTDHTCDGVGVHNLRQMSIPVALRDPLFEVKLDSKRMCILNPEEIQQKIIDKESEAKALANEVCPDGICGVARAENRNRFKCKCVEKKRPPEEVTECSELTCAEDGAQYDEEQHTDVLWYLITKLYNRIKNKDETKVTIQSIDTNQVRNKKSIFSSICERIKSTPEIWTGTPPHRRRRRRNPNIPANSSLYGMHKRDGFKLNVGKNHSDTCTCQDCNAKKKISLVCKCKSFISDSFSGLKHRHKYTVNGASSNYHRRNGLSLPPQQRRHTQHSYKTVNFAQVTDSSQKQEKGDNTCACAYLCECDEVWKKEKQKQKEKEEKLKHKKPKKAKKKPHKKKDNKIKKQQIEKLKQFESDDKKIHKKLEKKHRQEIKKKIKLYKIEQKEMKELSKQDEARDTNCLADCLLGLLKIILIGVKNFLSVLYKVIMQPKRSYRYCRKRLLDPADTWGRMRNWAGGAWQQQKFRMNRTIKGSQTMTILQDEFKETDLYQAFSYKGKTEAERRFIESSSKRRKKRIRKRNNAALYGCRHALLVTMRKTPCLWVYHILPNIYPQFLSARMFCINFGQMCMFCLAVMVWTPCIVCCELCRGLLCCMLCTH